MHCYIQCFCILHLTDIFVRRAVFLVHLRVRTNLKLRPCFPAATQEIALYLHPSSSHEPSFPHSSSVLLGSSSFAHLFFCLSLLYRRNVVSVSSLSFSSPSLSSHRVYCCMIHHGDAGAFPTELMGPDTEPPSCLRLADDSRAPLGRRSQTRGAVWTEEAARRIGCDAVSDRERTKKRHKTALKLCHTITKPICDRNRCRICLQPVNSSNKFPMRAEMQASVCVYAV